MYNSRHRHSLSLHLHRVSSQQVIEMALKNTSSHKEALHKYAYSTSSYTQCIPSDTLIYSITTALAASLLIVVTPHWNISTQCTLVSHTAATAITTQLWDGKFFQEVLCLSIKLY